MPPSRIPRRFDSESVRDESEYAGTPIINSTYEPTFGVPSSYDPPKASKAGKPAKNKYGLIPPPPPLTPSLLPPSLLPPSLLHAQVPPPPSEGMSATAMKGRWSTTVQKTLKRASVSPKVASFIDQAQARSQHLINEGKLAEAQALLKTYVKQLPRDASLKGELAKVSVQCAQQSLSNQDLEAAGKYAREAIAAQPTNQAAKSVLAQIVKKEGPSAGSSAQKASAEAYVGLGDIALKAGDKGKAKLEYQKALELEPHSATALRQMGILRLSQSDVVGANSDLSRALVLNPQDKLASKHLIELWQRQITHNPNTANSHLGMARAYQLSGDLQSAQGEYRKVVQIEPNNVNLPAARQSFKLALARQEAQQAVEAAHTLESSGAIKEAYQKISEAVSLSPGDASFRLYQAQLSEKLGMTADAHTAYMNVLKADPTNTEAAQRIKQLSVAPPALVMPGEAPPVAPQRNSLNTAATTATAAAAITAAAAAYSGGTQEAPPLAVLNGIPKPQVTTSPQVATMSSFLGSLRNFSVQQKAQALDAEDQAHAALKALTSPPELGAAAASSAVTQSPVIASASANLASVNSLLASLGVKSSSSGASPSTGSAAAAEAKPAAGEGAAAAKAPAPDSIAALLAASGGGASLSQLMAEAAPALQSKKVLTQKDIGALYQQLSKKYAPAVAPPSDAIAQRLGNLEEQNKKLQSQLQAAQDQLNALKMPPAVTPSNQVVAEAVPVPAQAILQSLPPSVTSSPAFQAAMANLPSSAAGLQSYVANLPPGTAASLQSYVANLPPESAASLQTLLKPPISSAGIQSNSAPTASGVRFELEGVKPSPLDIKLKVVLRNDQSVTLNVPASTKAIIRMKGQPQRVVKIIFPNKNVPPNSEMHGIIKVPGHNLSPAADLFIPNMLPGQGSDGDLHLTVPISFK